MAGVDMTGQRLFRRDRGIGHLHLDARVGESLLALLFGELFDTGARVVAVLVIDAAELRKLGVAHGGTLAKW